MNAPDGGGNFAAEIVSLLPAAMAEGLPASREAQPPRGIEWQKLLELSSSFFMFFTFWDLFYALQSTQHINIPHFARNDGIDRQRKEEGRRAGKKIRNWFCGYGQRHVF